MIQNIFLFLLLISILNGKIIDKVVMSVDNQAITLIEILSLKNRLNISQKEAIEILIKDRLEINFIKQVNISITSFNLEESIRQIENSKNLTREMFKQLVREQGISWTKYKKYLSEKIKKDIFLRKYVFKDIQEPTEFELNSYYKNNLSKFKFKNKMNIIAYISHSKDLLNILMTNPMKRVDGVATKYISVQKNNINPAIYKILNRTKVGEFTDIINIKGNFTMYYIQQKGINKLETFLSVKDKIKSLIIRKNEIDAEKNFFNKLKSNAVIKMI